MPNMQPRQLIVLSDAKEADIHHLINQTSYPWAMFSPKAFLNAKVQHFFLYQAKNALGQEWCGVVMDLREGLNLEALSIACGTLRAGGRLLLWVKDWANFSKQIDEDSLRWCEKGKQSCPEFRQFFVNLVEQFTFPVFTFPFKQDLPIPHQSPLTQPNPKGIAVQQTLLHQLLITHKNIILTAERGRGKSALCGQWLSQKLREKQPLILTAPNKKAIQTLQQFCDFPLPFYAPDRLLEQLKKGDIQAKILLIDEAAMLPLPLLEALIQPFSQVFCTTTVESYEGTGQGFSLKFMQNNHKDWLKTTLSIPLRWGEKDPLEKWLKALLLQNDCQSLPNQRQSLQFHLLSTKELHKKNWLIPFYQLLNLAHYRTTPLDLRRLFDAPKQHFFIATQEGKVIGGIWAVEEGGMTDDALISAILRGERRPMGHMVAQLLTQTSLEKNACRLKSLRISRIAITPEWQAKGIGSQLCRAFCETLKHQADFLSVSFGFTPKLAKFWANAGFNFAFLSERQGTSSGCYSAVGVLGLNDKGQAFCQQACHDFRKNIAIFNHPERAFYEFIAPFNEEQRLTEKDDFALWDFGHFHRPLYFTLGALTRFCCEKKINDPFIHQVLNNPFDHLSKQELKELRRKIARFVE